MALAQAAAVFCFFEAFFVVDIPEVGAGWFLLGCVAQFTAFLAMLGLGLTVLLGHGHADRVAALWLFVLAQAGAGVCFFVALLSHDGEAGAAYFVIGCVSQLFAFAFLAAVAFGVLIKSSAWWNALARWLQSDFGSG